MSPKSWLERLRGELRGKMILPGDATDDRARRPGNPLLDVPSAAIVRPADVADVIATVRQAREGEMRLAVRAAGHYIAGQNTVDVGVVLDLDAMHSVHVDPRRRVARVEGGATWGDLDHATHAFSLAAPGGAISTTGVAGLTLSGGFGHLTRKFGLSCDNLRSADVVTAEGKLLHASMVENADLFWALRGGGGHVGVVTSMEFQIHPIGLVYGGPIFYPASSSTDVLQLYREYIANAPDDVSVFVGFHVIPPVPFVSDPLHGAVACAVVVCHLGSVREAERDVAPFRQQLSPVLDLCAPIAYPTLNRMFDALLPPGLYHDWKVGFASDIQEGAIDVHQQYGPRARHPHSFMHIYPLNGAPQRVPQDITAFSYRDASFAHVIGGAPRDPAEIRVQTAWSRTYWQALRPYALRGGYTNELTAAGDVRNAPTIHDTNPRLTATRAVYDPTNLF